MKPRRALIIGGSVAGLFAAHFLRRAGWSAQIFERSHGALSGRGAGIVTHPELWRLLEAAGLPVQDLGIPVTRRVVLAPDGAERATLDCYQVLTAWDRLWRLLRDALPGECYTEGAEFTAAIPTPDGIIARFDDAPDATGDVLIGADGIRSTVRAALFGDVAPEYAGYVAWRGLVDESEVDPALFPLFAFCLPPGEQALGYPVAGRDDAIAPGQRRYNWVWYRPAPPRELAALLTDASGRRHTLSIPPTHIRAPFVLALRARARATLAPGLAAAVAATTRPLLQPIYDLASPRLAAGRAALIGDAAFVARPHVGAGATKAAEDALALAGALAETDVLTALVRYEAERLPAGQRFLRRARHLGDFLDPARTHPDRVLAETAVLDF